MTFVHGMRGVGVPSRLYNILASGRPVIAAVDATSEPALAVEGPHGREAEKVPGNVS